MIVPETDTPIPVYRVMDTKGNIVDSSHDPKVSDTLLAFCKILITFHL